MWGRNKRWRELLVAALYDELTSNEHDEFARIMASSDVYRSEYESMRRLKDLIPSTPVSAPDSLLVGIRARLEEPKRKVVLSPVLRFAAAALPVLLCVLAYQYALDWVVKTSTPSQMTHLRIDESPVLQLRREAEAMMAQQEFGNAYRVLQAAIESYPDDLYVGPALQDLADLFFDKLQRYEDAYAVYARLRNEYPEIWEQHTVNIARFNLLDEARIDGFAALRRLDIARSRRWDDTSVYEEVIAGCVTQQPQVAALAAREMVRNIMSDGVDAMTALEYARARCDNTVAGAWFDVEIGRAYWRNLGDAEAARTWGEKALASNEPGVIAMARGLLNEVDTAE